MYIHPLTLIDSVLLFLHSQVAIEHLGHVITTTAVLPPSAGSSPANQRTQLAGVSLDQLQERILQYYYYY